jgi:uncharacterized protein (TIGR02246 family)
MLVTRSPLPRSHRLPSALLAAGLALLPAGAWAAHGGALHPDAKQAVAAVLEIQAQAWNRGDLLAFVSVYKEDTLFVSPTGLTRGRTAVLERYRDRYPDRAAMGRLAFEIEDLRVFTGPPDCGGKTAVTSAAVVGRWQLTYPEGEREDASGLTLLVLEPHPGGWQIVHDASM